MAACFYLTVLLLANYAFRSITNLSMHVKLYEYQAVSKPIICCLKEGPAERARQSFRKPVERKKHRMG